MSEPAELGPNGAETNELDPKAFKALSTLLSRQSLALRAGLQFDGDRDLYATFGYKLGLRYDDFLAKYLRQDIAARIVDSPPAATWSAPPLVNGNVRFNKAFTKLTRKHKIWSVFERADRLCGLGQFSIIFMGFDDGVRADTPIAPGRKHNLIYVQPYSEASVRVEALEQNTSNPRFGLPTLYMVEVVDPIAGPQIGGVSTESTRLRTKPQKVHWTRVIHVAETSLEDNVYGNPRMMKVYNLLDDLIKVVGGAAEGFWMSGNRGIHADIDKEMELSKGDADALADEIKEYQHTLRRVIQTRGVDITPLGTSVPNPKQAADLVLALISGATGIPKRILTGSEAGQLASEQDRANWADRINERIFNFAEPVILRPFIDAVASLGAVPNPGEAYDIEWPSAYKLTPLEEDQSRAQYARSIVNLSKQSQQGREISTIEEDRIRLGLPEVKPETQIDPVDIPGQEQEVRQPDDEEDEEGTGTNASASTSASGSNRTTTA